MRIRIKPRDIEVPENDPFKNDLLDRKEPVEILTHLIGSLEGPVVLSVDAAWGNGKTTFLKIWAQYLRNQKFPIVDFNAWETDFSGDPFLALSERITNGLGSYSDESLKKKIDETKKMATKVLRHAVPAIIRVATAGIFDVSPMLEKEVGQTLASLAKDRLAMYEEAQESVKKFRVSLQAMAGALWKENRPLVVMIDELDRCRPSYAVELLEVAKHLFSMDHIVFVLAINRSELAHSVKALYGSGFDAHGYLGRFFDIDFRLPEPNRNNFIVNLLRSINMNPQMQGFVPAWQNASNLLFEFFGTSDLSLRKVEQAIHHFGLVLASSNSNNHSDMIDTIAAIILILRAFIPDSYYRFCNGEVSDLQLVSELFKHPGINLLREKTKAFVAAIIVISKFDMSKTSYRKPELSELWNKYQNVIETSNSQDRLYEEETIRWINDFISGPFIRFLETSKRIELLAPDLIQDSASRP